MLFSVQFFDGRVGIPSFPSPTRFHRRSDMNNRGSPTLVGSLGQVMNLGPNDSFFQLGAGTAV